MARRPVRPLFDDVKTHPLGHKKSHLITGTFIESCYDEEMGLWRFRLQVPDAKWQNISFGFRTSVLLNPKPCAMRRNNKLVKEYSTLTKICLSTGLVDEEYLDSLWGPYNMRGEGNRLESLKNRMVVFRLCIRPKKHNLVADFTPPQPVDILPPDPENQGVIPRKYIDTLEVGYDLGKVSPHTRRGRPVQGHDRRQWR